MTSSPSSFPSDPALQPLVQALVQAWRADPALDEAAWAAAVPTEDTAYAVQSALWSALEGGAATPRFWKSGGPSRTAALTHAPLPAGGVMPHGGDARGQHLRLRLVEAEVALRLARDVTTEAAAALDGTAADGLVDAMCVSIELVDSRWQAGRTAPTLLKLADLQSHGALVLGAFVPWAPRDWAQQACQVRIGAAVHDFRGSHSLGDPAWLLPAWLRHATARHGTVPAGTVVTTGTWCGLLPARAGDRIEVDFPGIGRCAVQL